MLAPTAMKWMTWGLQTSMVGREWIRTEVGVSIKLLGLYV
jgi:hypothetical protein